MTNRAVDSELVERSKCDRIQSVKTIWSLAGALIIVSKAKLSQTLANKYTTSVATTTQQQNILESEKHARFKSLRFDSYQRCTIWRKKIGVNTVMLCNMFSGWGVCQWGRDKGAINHGQITVPSTYLTKYVLNDWLSSLAIGYKALTRVIHCSACFSNWLPRRLTRRPQSLEAVQALWGPPYQKTSLPDDMAEIHADEPILGHFFWPNCPWGYVTYSEVYY